MNTIRLNTKLIRSLSDVLFMTAADIMKATGIKQTTWYAVKKKPEDITVQQLLAIANGLHIPVRRFFSSEGAILIGKRDDYIMESYTECSYDADALQELVSNHADMTWKKAAENLSAMQDQMYSALEKWDGEAKLLAQSQKQVASLQQLTENLRERIADKDKMIAQLEEELNKK